MHKILSFSFLVATALTAPAMADETSVWRLFVGDHTAPQVTAIDLATGTSLATLPLASPASLYAADGAVFAVQGAGNQVSAIDPGIAVDDHGNHGDIEVTAPALIEAVMAGEKPVHFVEHGGKIALFFDGTGSTSIVEAHRWVDDGEVTANGATPWRPIWIRSGAIAARRSSSSAPARWTKQTFGGVSTPVWFPPVP